MSSSDAAEKQQEETNNTTNNNEEDSSTKEEAKTEEVHPPPENLFEQTKPSTGKWMDLIKQLLKPSTVSNGNNNGSMMDSNDGDDESSVHQSHITYSSPNSLRPHVDYCRPKEFG